MDDIIDEILQELESPKTTISGEKLQTFLYEEMDRIGGIVDESITPRQRSARTSALVRKVRPLITAENELASTARCDLLPNEIFLSLHRLFQQR